MRIKTRKIRCVTAGKYPDDTLIIWDINKGVNNCVCVRHKVRLPSYPVHVEAKHIVHLERESDRKEEGKSENQ